MDYIQTKKRGVGNITFGPCLTHFVRHCDQDALTNPLQFGGCAAMALLDQDKVENPFGCAVVLECHVELVSAQVLGNRPSRNPFGF